MTILFTSSSTLNLEQRHLIRKYERANGQSAINGLSCLVKNSLRRKLLLFFTSRSNGNFTQSLKIFIAATIGFYFKKVKEVKENKPLLIGLDQFLLWHVSGNTSPISNRYRDPYQL